ncbi:hypothetical protein [Borrelia coriaceae]|uniref:Uncharacterized protein n=1 Tax=Borrelia coriaceae ATCC 43381 TaxID=1408429 RepID=W5STA1_9SPIR|nr:hypothetical protein [Borrelia coriaceae]AHH10384.1 Hypothetical protein BCO_0093100 [Borrelia coriaceae ATCC 43381]
MKLYNKGMFFTRNSGRNYYFNKISDVKPEMLAYFVKNGLWIVLKFVCNSDVILVKIKTAHQGCFEFLSVDRSFDNYESYSKNVLIVVTTFSYYLG